MMDQKQNMQMLHNLDFYLAVYSINESNTFTQVFNFTYKYVFPQA